ncbi:polyprenyl synthetase family protein [Legionella dresdenensis]|uniref:Polyprenyl synthetase family protein n=1 Tax=Legionella dresdenensis TaxID=450200 RepID=A0ABV8CHS9_9GAMM
MNNPHINRLLTHHERVLEQLMQSTNIPAARIKESILYSLFPGGKRLRPLLVYLAGELLKLPVNCLDIIAASVEITHCYSLIHDDLPAMDDDDFRRGKASCHRAFDEATAILAGDGMQALAIQILLCELPRFLSAEKTNRITCELVTASGVSGMVSGQSLDLTELATKTVTENQLRTIHLLKTGKLISACINMTIIASDTDNALKEALQTFAHHLGLVFQMQDDYLDHYVSTDVLGKGRSSDIANQKTTFASLYSQSELSSLISEHYQLATKALAIFGDNAQNLLDLTHSMEQRSLDAAQA